MGRRREEVNPLALDEAISLVSMQGVEFPNLSAALLNLRKMYTDTPSYYDDGTKLNTEGLEVLEHQAAQVAVEAINQQVVLGGESWAIAIDRVRDAREYQISKWTSLVEPDRSLEEWILLTEEYQHRFLAVVRSGEGKGDQTHIERVRKYAAIVSNLALWAVQTALGKIGHAI